MEDDIWKYVTDTGGHRICHALICVVCSGLLYYSIASSFSVFFIMRNSMALHCLGFS